MRDNIRKLSLKREALAPLTTDELVAVAGASHVCGVTDACTDTVTHGPSVDQSCPTVPPTTCFVIGAPYSRIVCL